MGLPQLDPAQRLTLVDHITPGAADGNSLSGVNVDLYPEGALFFVNVNTRLYVLHKNLDSSVVADTVNNNVVDGINSSAAAGRFIALEQYGTGVLSAGVIAISGFDVTRGGRFFASYQTIGGTPGILHAAKTANNTVTVTSSSNADTSTVAVLVMPV